MKKTKYAPLPWTVEPGEGSGTECIVSEVGTIAVLEHNPYQKGINGRTNAEFIVRACNAHEVLLKALKAAVDRMDAVAKRIPVENRAKGVSPATHVRHMAGHLAQHAKLAHAAIAKAEGRA